MTTEQLMAFVIKVSDEHAGVAVGLSEAVSRIPVQRLMEIVDGLGVRGQELYDLYGLWLRADDKRFEQNPSFATWLQTLNVGQ